MSAASLRESSFRNLVQSGDELNGFRPTAEAPRFATEARSVMRHERGDVVPAYLFIKTKIHDPEQYAKYVAEVRKLAGSKGSRYIVRSQPVEVLEGSPEQWGDFLLLVSEWPSVEAARDFWNSPEYRKVRELRADAGEVHVVLAEALPPPPGIEASS